MFVVFHSICVDAAVTTRISLSKTKKRWNRKKCAIFQWWENRFAMLVKAVVVSSINENVLFKFRWSKKNGSVLYSHRTQFVHFNEKVSFASTIRINNVVNKISRVTLKMEKETATVWDWDCVIETKADIESERERNRKKRHVQATENYVLAIFFFKSGLLC